MRKQFKVLPALCLFILGMIHASDAKALYADFEIKASRGTHEENVKLEWEKVSWARGYHISRSCNYGGPYITKAFTRELDYSDTDAEGGKYYWYKVRPQYWLVSGLASKRVQGWVQPRMTGGMVEMTERLLGIVGQVPHFYNVRVLADKRRNSLPEPDISSLEVPDNEDIFRWIEKVCEPPHRRIGSPESFSSVEYIKSRLESSLNVEVHDDPVPLDAVYTAETWGLTIHEDGKTTEFPAFYIVNTGMSLNKPDGGIVSGEMVWASGGTPDDFRALADEGRVEGKIIVAECEFPDLPLGLLTFLFNGGYSFSDPENYINLLTSTPMTFARSNFPPEYTDFKYDDSVYWLAEKYGAAGLVLVMRNHPGDVNTHWGPYDGKMRDLPGMWVSSFKADEMAVLAKKGLSATITIKGTVRPGQGHNIYARLPGQSDETILISTHHDSCFKGATEDGTGVGMVLAQAETWGKVPFEQREKTIVFSLTDGHHYRGIGAEHFAEEHLDDIMKKTIININLEHLAAKAVEVNENGSYQTTKNGSNVFIFINENPTAIATVSRMLDNLKPDKTVAIHSTLLGDVPPGEAGHFHIKAGIDFIHWIGHPVYLLNSEDTLDKIDQSMLNPIAESVAEMVKTFMMLPNGYSDYE